MLPGTVTYFLRGVLVISTAIPTAFQLASNIYTQEQFFTCYSGQVLSPESICNGVLDCMFLEDETKCDNLDAHSMDGAYLDPSLVPNKQILPGIDDNMQHSINTATQHPCGSEQPDYVYTPCPLMWGRPQTMYYYDSIRHQCMGFQYSGGCGGQSQMLLTSFHTFEECAQSCHTMDLLSTSRAEINSQPQFFSCYDGTYIPTEMACNRVLDCNNGEDEFNCFGLANTFQQQDEGMPSIVMDLTPETYHHAVLGNAPILLDLYKKGCKSCAVMKPEFERAAHFSQGSGVLFARMRVDNIPEILQMHNITTFPRILFWHKGWLSEFGPKRYYKNYGLNAERLLNWLQTQLSYPQSGCPGNPLQFQCANTKSCLSSSVVCDGQWQCSDGSDEYFCQTFDKIEDHFDKK